MFATLLALATALLALATAVYVTRLVRYGTEVPLAANVMMGLAVVALGGAVAVGLVGADVPLKPNALIVLIFVTALVGLGLLAQTTWDLAVAAPVIAPLAAMVALALLLRALVIDPSVPVSGDRSLTIVHVSATVLGVLLFSPAFVLSGLFLGQSYRLKTKQLSRARLPSLLTLERAAWRLVFIGFPFYTVGILLGVIWQDQLHLGIRPRQVVAALSWALYAFVIYRRLSTGWRGARAAVVQIAAFSVMVCAVLLYMLR